ncbi:hypothetical protein RHMOL_Rhmol02G0277400 [Rhododendron molle]|uniref:Uncharacterized protein n=1 Tax=Rhododendron molle TaxID=49168 RepID=A0ACC0PWM3_RHOML|nr:hypothetical protein RHMOL_Rhmol02G0277400 [Rhododendron molle]
MLTLFTSSLYLAALVSLIVASAVTSKLVGNDPCSLAVSYFELELESMGMPKPCGCLLLAVFCLVLALDLPIRLISLSDFC